MNLISTGTLREIKKAAPWLMALVMISVSVALKCQTIVHFDSNDDPGMMMTAGGILSSVAPSEDLIHTSPLIGLALKHLYTTFPGLPWYALYLYSLTLLYLGLCVYVVVNITGGTVWSCFVILLFLVPFVSHALVTLQFTLVAFNLTSVALFVSLEQLNHTASNWLKLAFALLLTFVAGCVRVRLQGVFPVGLLVFAFWLPWFAVSLRKPEQRRWAGISFSMLFFAILFLPRAISDFYYRNSPEWATFYEDNAARGRLLNTSLSRIDATQSRLTEVLKKTGWSVNDLQLAQSWFLADRKTYSGERMNRFCQLALPAKLHYGVWATVKRNTLGYWQYTGCFALLVCYLSLRRPTLRHICLQVANVSYVFLLLVYIGVVTKTVDRMVLPVILTGVMISIYIYSRLAGEKSDAKTKAARAFVTTVGAFVATLLVVVQLYCLNDSAREVNEGRVRLLNYIDELTRINPTGYYVSWGGYLGEQWWPPFSRETESRSGIKVIRIGGITGSPISDRWTRSLGFEDLTDALIQRRDVYVLASEASMKRLMTFYREHRGIRARYDRLGGNDYDVWQVARSRRIK